jgi:predicted amidophosphoribosyltransferase
MNLKEPKGLFSSCNRAVALDADTCPHCSAPLSTKGLTPETPDSQAAKPQSWEQHFPGVKSADELSIMSTEQKTAGARSLSEHCIRERA